MFDRKGNRKYLNGPERRGYFQAVKDESDRLRRAFCLTLFYTGCRISEALNLTPERIDLTGKAIVFETLKRRERGQFRSVPIPDSLVRVLSGIVGKLEPGIRVWKFSRPTAYRVVKDGMARAGIAGAMACPKGLRHGFAIACIGQNVPLTVVQRWLGHARLETTAIYLEVSGNEERELAKRVWGAS